jgi:hypothetical protein
MDGKLFEVFTVSQMTGCITKEASVAELRYGEWLQPKNSFTPSDRVDAGYGSILPLVIKLCFTRPQNFWSKFPSFPAPRQCDVVGVPHFSTAYTMQTDSKMVRAFSRNALDQILPCHPASQLGCFVHKRLVCAKLVPGQRIPARAYHNSMIRLWSRSKERELPAYGPKIQRLCSVTWHDESSG